jgi:hypothetical protein
MSRRSLVLFAALMFELVASAAEVQVRLKPRVGAAMCATRGWLVGRDAAGGRVERVPLGAGETVYRLTLPGAGTWEFTVESEGCWSETVVWGHAQSTEIDLHVFRAGFVESVFSSETESPPELRGVVFPLGSGSVDMSMPSSASTGIPAPCKLDYPRWQCSVPANTPLDLRLDAPGFGTIYYWSVVADSVSTRQLEPQRLVRGSSVAGWIEDGKGVPVAAAKVTLYPLEAEVSRPDMQRIAARLKTTTANHRGFFQITGLEAGTYRLVSEADGLSPTTVAELRVRAGESLVWPRAIVHVPPAALEISLDPPVDPDGNQWVVELAEERPLHLERVPTLTRPATKEGRWTAAPLRADVYELTIREKHGSEVEVVDIDLSDGGLKSISLDVRSIAVQGVLRLAGESLNADITFSNRTGKIVRASTSDDGTFTARFPTGGGWTPSIRYPRERGSSITLDDVDIDPAKATSQQLELDVPGGRIRGQAVRANGSPEHAAVYVLREGKPVAQVITKDNGKFDFVGMKAGAYAITAEGLNSSTDQPLQIDIATDDVKDVRLVLAPMRRIAGTVLTPHGTPASGAVVHVLSDDGRSWTRVVTDIAGQFEYSVPGSTGEVTLIVLTYAYPSAMTRMAVHALEHATIALKADGGILRLRNGAIPYVRGGGGVVVPMRALFFPEPFGRFNGGMHLEPGAYVVCPNRSVETTCRTVTIAPGADVDVDFQPAPKSEPGS